MNEVECRTNHCECVLRQGVLILVDIAGVSVRSVYRFSAQVLELCSCGDLKMFYAARYELASCPSRSVVEESSGQSDKLFRTVNCNEFPNKIPQT